MKPFSVRSLVVAIVVAALVVGTAFFAAQHGQGKGAAPAGQAGAGAGAEPVVQVQSELAQSRVMTETLTAFGDVSAGQLSGLSFTRAGQVTQLAVLPGDRVAQGALLATLAADPASREAYAQAVNAATSAKREADRLNQLLALQLATRSQVDAAQKAAQDAAGALNALDAQGGGAASSRLAAPFDGVVASVALAQGDRVQPGSPVLQLARADLLRVQIGIEPSESVRVPVGTPVSLLPIVAPGREADAFAGRVASVQGTVDPKTQLTTVIVLLPRRSAERLTPGMKVQASLQVGSRTRVAVPRNAVLSDDRGDHVYQIAAGKAHRVAVAKQIEVDGFVAITGLTDLSLPVVTVGNHELQDGMAVREAPR